MVQLGEQDRGVRVALWGQRVQPDQMEQMEQTEAMV
jgi:hypothetical protein